MKKLSILILILALTLSGCQLARTDLEPSGDRLVGMFLTTEYLDLFDAEAYFLDNMNKIDHNGFIDADSSAYEGRLYAQEVPEILYDEQGNPVEHRKWDFPDVEGICYFAPRSYEDRESFINTRSDDAILDGHTDVKYTDEGEEITLTGTVILAHSGEQIVCYFNPVYQSADGRVYAKSGHSMSTSEDNAPGALYSHKLSETTTVNNNGEKETASMTVTISMETAYEPEHYMVVQMDEQNEVLSSDRYLPGQLPEELILQEEAAYVLLETHTEEQTTREIFDSTTETLKTLYCREDGFFGQMFTSLVW